MTLREILNERSFEDENRDKNHPVQGEVEKKFNKLVYDYCLKDKLQKLENKYHILDKTYDEVAALLGDKEFLGDKYGHDEAGITKERDGFKVRTSASWRTEEPEDKDNYHNIIAGDSWAAPLRKNTWEADKENYRKILNGDIDALIKAKIGAGRWNLYRGQAFWFGDKGFRLTDDYKIIDNTEDDYKNFNTYSPKQIAEYIWTHHGERYPAALNRLHIQAFEKFNNSNEFAAWIAEKPSRREKLSEIMEKVLGKRRW